MELSESVKKVMLSEGASPGERAQLAVDKLTKGVPIAINQGNVWQFYDAATKLSETRHGRYRDYDLMEDDSLLASALELMTDDVCQYSPEKQATIWPSAGSDTGFINQTFQELDIENRIWGWCYNIAKYGDFFLQTRLDDKGKFIGFDESVHPRNVRRIDIGGRLTAFATVSNDKFVLKDPWQFIHFINNYKPSFERVRIKQIDAASQKESIITVTSRYGTSSLEAARKVYKILNLLEQAIALARLNRSPLIRVFYINTEGMTPDERDDTLDRLERHFKEQLSLDMTSGLYKADYKALSFNADIFIPYSGGKGDVRIDQLGGELNIRDIADINYIKNKLFAALRIPQAFLGFEESLPGGGGQMSLVRLDIRYSRMVKKLQRATLIGLRRLLAIRYAYKTGRQPTSKQVDVSMEVISGVEEMDRMAGLERRMGVAQQMITMMRDMEGSAVDPTPVYDYVFSDILGLKGLGLKFRKKPAQPEGEGQFASVEIPPSMDLLLDGLKEEKVTFEQAIPVLREFYRSQVTRSNTSGEGDFGADLPKSPTENEILVNTPSVSELYALCEERDDEKEDDARGNDLSDDSGS